MAKILSAAKSGSVGPSTFVHSPKYGLIERVRIKPFNPRTLSQQNHRGFVAAAASDWRSRTDPEQVGWHALGAQLTPPVSGAQAYIKVNVTLSDCGLPMLHQAPAKPALGRLTSTGLLVRNTPCIQLLQVSDLFGADYFVLESCRSVSAGIGFVGDRLVQFAVLPSHGAAPAELDLTAAYLARFEPPRLGRRMVVRITPMKNGFKGLALECRTLVTAG